MYFVRKIITAASVLFAFILANTAFAQSATYDRMRAQTVADVRAKVQPLLMQYCKDSCLIIDIAAEIDEGLGESEDLGFEGVVGEDAASLMTVSKVSVQIQVDDRVTSVNRERLATIIKNNMPTVNTDVIWKSVTLPQIGQSMAKEEQLKRQVQQRVSQAVDKVIEAYCPETCVLSQTTVEGKLITQDESLDVAPEELARDRGGNAILKIDGIDVEVSMDDSLTAPERNKIMNVMKARTRFHGPLTLDVMVTAFPESYASRKERETKASADPHGLGQLRETLSIFREMAGTKEIISTSHATSSDRSQTREQQRDSAAPGQQTEAWEWVLYAAALIIVTGLVLFLILRFAGASRDARIMMQEAFEHRAAGSAVQQAHSVQHHGAAQENARISEEQRRDLGTRMRNEDLKKELIGIFVDQPRVAKETFSRLLQEEGIEETAKYVHIFGHMVVFELLGDPNLQRDLFELSEYYHKSNFDFSVDEEFKLLSALKTRVTANEIRILTRKQMDQFDFLGKLDSTQIYNLIAEEKPQVQSIILTQLDHKRRRSVFEMYQGEAKVDLMRELCRADAIPKEYLANIAMVLHKKVTSRPEFDAENLRSSDILLDLLEKANLNEQKALMRNLSETNPEAARAIKLKLVTVEVIPHLKDGHLLEIMMGLDRDDVKMFLAGTRDHIRTLILSKAPDELAESWVEDLENLAGFDEQAFRLAEMKILSRVRSLVNNGAINLIDLNDTVFADTSDDHREGGDLADQQAPQSGSEKSLVA